MLCDKCPTFFEDEIDLKEHQKSEHPTPNFPRNYIFSPFICEQCGEFFTMAYYLQKHRKAQHKYYVDIIPLPEYFPEEPHRG